MRALLAAVAFLTRLPVPARAVEPHELGRALGFFPLVGGLLGALLGAALFGLSRVLAPELCALLAVALWALLTGGLHLDGLADLFDALGGGRGDRERMLEIMRDSRIGAHGAVALVLVLCGKVLAVAELPGRTAVATLLVAPAVARFGAVLLLALFPYARGEGLGRAFRDHGKARDLAAAALLMLGSAAILGRRALVPGLAALLVALALGGLMRRKLGGLTGDVYGAAIELSELAFLLASTVG
jgi:adenosylcobinamide-GDP ribazoletransferase